MKGESKFFVRYILFLVGAAPSAFVNSAVQKHVYFNFSFLVAASVGTAVGFMVKYIWDYLVVFGVSLKSYVGSSIIATAISLIIEWILVQSFGVMASSLFALFIGYNVKFLIDQKEFNRKLEDS